MVIFTEYSAFFAAPYLAEALGCNLFVMDTTHNSFFGLNTVKGVYCGKHTEKIIDNQILIIGIKALSKISSRVIKKDFDRIILILCDTEACKKFKWWNSFVIENNIELFIMPDLKNYCFCKYKPIYQYIKVDERLISNKQQSTLLISHSPRSSNKMLHKGSNFIINTINKLKNKYSFDFNLITGLPRSKAIEEKSKSHIFIDQMIYKNDEINQHRFGNEITYNGGLGKSGIEAMITGCAVITGGEYPNTLPFFKNPPIKFTSTHDFYNDLENLIINENLRNSQIQQQHSWINDYNDQFLKKYMNI